MSEIVKKITKLNNPESFIQINTVKGFKYVDKAGEIVNNYYLKNNIPKLDMGLNGLTIFQPKEKIDQLRVTPQVIWMKFVEVDSFDMILTLFIEEVEKTLIILDVDKISRIGWRNYFIFNFKNKENQQEYFNKLSKFKGGKLSSIKFEINTEKKFNLFLELLPVVKKGKEEIFGVLFDVDIFQEGEFQKEDISVKLKEFREYLAAEDGFLGIVNNTFLMV